MVKKFNLLQYSIFAAHFICFKEVVAQVEYFDIIPDDTIDADLEYIQVDLDNNGIYDFSFRNRSYDFSITTYFSSYSLVHFENIFAGPQNPQNEIAANSFSTGLSGFYDHKPYALPFSFLINSELNFWNSQYLQMAFKSGGIGGGAWYPEVTDRYLGVYFRDDSACFHYGWIRCDVINSGRTLIVKDHGYESKCNIGILAGDKIGDTTTTEISETNNLDITIYSFENTIFINKPNDIISAKAIIYTISGKIVASFDLDETQISIPLLNQNGIYIVEIIFDNFKQIKKVYIH